MSKKQEQLTPGYIIITNVHTKLKTRICVEKIKAVSDIKRMDGDKQVDNTEVLCDENTCFTCFESGEAVMALIRQAKGVKS